MVKEEGNSPLTQRINVWTLGLAQVFVESGLDFVSALVKAQQVSAGLVRSFPELHKPTLPPPPPPSPPALPQRNKPGPKPGQKALRAKEASRARAAEGRLAVARGERPPVKEAIIRVLGDRIMSGEDVYEGLVKRDWLPNSKEPRKYVGYLLSSTKDRFEAVKSSGRGMYRAVGVASVEHPAPVVEPKNEVPTPSKPQQEDDILADLGGMFEMPPKFDKSESVLDRIAPLLDKPRRPDWLARKLNKPLPEVHIALRSLEEDGSVVRVKEGDRTVWALSPKAKSDLSSP